MGKALKTTLQTEGVFGLWRGLGPTVFRDVPFSGIYWAIYESLKVHHDVTVPTFGFSFFGGAVSGSVSHNLASSFGVSTHSEDKTIILFFLLVIHTDRSIRDGTI